MPSLAEKQKFGIVNLENLDEALVRQVAAGGRMAHAAEAPLEQSGVFYNQAEWQALEEAYASPAYTPPVDSSAEIFSSTGQPLPSVHDMLILKEWWENSATNLGKLVAKTVLSPTTGCLTRMMWRNSEGYIRVRNPHRFGIPLRADAEEKRGMLLHRLAYTVYGMEFGGDHELAKGLDIDHVCRNTACGNPYHLRAMTNKENNLERLKAVKLETALLAGQLMIGPTKWQWLDEKIQAAESEDTNMVIATRGGPYRIMKVDDKPQAIYGVREPDEVFEALQPPSPDRRNFKSRAKKVGIAAGQRTLALAVR